MKSKMAYFNGRSLFSGIAVSYLFLINGSKFLISGIIGTIIGVLFLLLIKNVNNYKLTKALSGFVIASICSLIIVNMGHTLYLKATPLWILAIVPILGVMIMSESKSESLIHVLNYLFIYSLVLFFFKILGLYPHIDMENLLPFYPYEVKNIAWGSLVFALVGVVPIISINDISDKKNIISNYLVSMTTILVLGFLALSVLGVKESILYRYPEFVVLKRIEFLNFINNVDVFFNFAIVLDVMFTMSGAIKNVAELGKSVKYISLFMIFLFTIFACENNWPLLVIYYYFPFILIFLLILILIPKK